MGNMITFTFKNKGGFIQDIIKLGDLEGTFEGVSLVYIDNDNAISIRTYKEDLWISSTAGSISIDALKIFLKKVCSYLQTGGYARTQNDDLRTNEYDEEIWGTNIIYSNNIGKFGRDKLLHAPCELIEEWEDGSIFMMINRRTFESRYEQRKKLREYLGEKTTVADK